MSAAEKREREREKAARKAAKAGLKEEKDVEEEEDNDDGFFEEEEEFDGPDPRIAQVCTPALRKTMPFEVSLRTVQQVCMHEAPVSRVIALPALFAAVHAVQGDTGK